MSNAEAQRDEQLRMLLQTVERLRAERYPHLDADLVQELLQLHADPAASDADLARHVEQSVERHLSKSED